jgi:hypothetical protein
MKSEQLEIDRARMELYRRYRAGDIDRKEYYRLIEPLDKKAELCELALLKCTPFWGKGSEPREGISSG